MGQSSSIKVGRFRRTPTAAQKKEAGEDAGPTWVHDIFQGTLTNETKCLSCETVRSKDEDFLDLSVDIDQNTSLTHCLRSGHQHCSSPQ